jgi:hypothetical protein
MEIIGEPSQAGQDGEKSRSAPRTCCSSAQSVKTEMALSAPRRGMSKKISSFATLFANPPQAEPNSLK